MSYPHIHIQNMDNFLRRKFQDKSITFVSFLVVSYWVSVNYGEAIFEKVYRPSSKSQKNTLKSTPMRAQNRIPARAREPACIYIS